MTARSRIATLVLALGLLAISIVHGQEKGFGLIDGVRVEKSDRQELVLELRPQIVQAKLPDGDILPRIGSGIMSNSDRPGEPIRMEIPIPVALPGSSGSRLEILSVQYEEPKPGRIAPVPEIRTNAAGLSVPFYRMDALAYARHTNAPQVAELLYDGIARDLHAGHIAVVPYIYDATSNTIRFLRSVRLRLRYGAGSGSGAGTGNLFAARGYINSDIASAWAMPLGGIRGFTRRTAAAAARGWMRVEVKEDGLYMLTAEDFRQGGIDLETVDPEKIAIYGGNGGILNEQDLMVNAGMHQVPAIVEREGNRAVRIYFFGAGPRRWNTEPDGSLPVHELNPYVNANSYIIAVGGDFGLQFPTGGMQGTPSATVSTGIAGLFQEEDKLNAVDIGKQGGSGRDWFGMQFQVDGARPTDTRVLSMKLPGLVRSEDITYRIRCAHSARHDALNAKGSFQIAERDHVLGDIAISEMSGVNELARASVGTFTSAGSNIDGDNTSLLRITYSNSVPAAGFLDWYEVHYTRSLVAENDQLFFEAAPGDGLARFVTEGFTSAGVFGFDITDRARPSRLDLSMDGGHATFTDALNTISKSHRYLIAGRNAARRVENVAKVGFNDLRRNTSGAQVVVITHPDFTEAARKYCEYRNSRGMSATWVTTEDIYTEFSNGNLDPTAIRNFIAYAYHTWHIRPTHVLLFGDGHYDYRHIIFKQKQLVPPYETDDGDVYHHIYSSCYDDFFVRVTTGAKDTVDGLADIAIGRLPVETMEAADVVIAKIKRYEEVGNFGLWRETIGLVADDDDPQNDGGGFTGHSEGLISVMPSWMESKKIYLVSYPMEEKGVRRSPIAESDLAQTIDRGAVITNWVGHGNPNVWGHEYILEKDKFISRLRNDSMLTYVPAVTCNFGYFDDPTVVSGGEMFVLHPNGGAIGVMTATRAVIIENNSGLMRRHMAMLFKRDQATGSFPTLGEALLETKRGNGARSGNDEKFLLLGDPALRLNLPKDSVHITSINTTDADSTIAVVGALTQVTIQGEVMNHTGSRRDDFDGKVIISLFDADRPTHVDSKVRSGNVITTYDVLYNGGRLFRGATDVHDGRFTITFRVPKDIAYDSSQGRVYAYAYNNREDAAGMTRNVIIYGADDSPVTDVQGPAINLFVDDRSFRSGDMVTPEPMLIVDLSDASGINSSGSSIGHRIEAWIDGSATSVDLTETYQTEPTDYGKGSAQRKLLELEPGEHQVRVRAWDIYNNVAESSTYFRIAAGDAESMRITEVVNYPNPMTHETDFLFRHNQVRPLDVDIDIFTTSGRKIRTLESRSVTDRFVRVHWDGTDADGRQLANGVYLYRLTVRRNDDEGIRYETIETVAIVR